jgi:phenylalanyl-tRNA synthetase beta chain
MNVSYRWLREFFPDGALEGLGPHELAQRLTMQGLPVDEVRPAFPSFSGVVVGKVLSTRPHPGADRLTLCTVTAGDGTREVVCGAPNVEIGAFYGYAAEGARLPGDRRIRRAEIRGVESEGMLCSAPELGLDPLGSAEGIWRVPGVDDDDLGRDLREILGLDDWILVVDVTSNRGDALSHLGIAREIQWMVDAACVPPPPALVEGKDLPAASSRSSVTIEDAEGCPSYLGRIIDEVRVTASPGWLQTRLVALGMRPVNNVVDATNMIMLECGQPLHPFDFDRVSEGRIVVRRAKLGERFTTLDGKTRELDPAMTMIADARGAIAIGGVMGGLESEMTETTTTVFLESAHFDPGRVARTARRLGITSEAATRFARGVDPALPNYALDRAAGLIAAVSGGRVTPGRVGFQGWPETHYVALRLARASALIGFGIRDAEARRALETLGFSITAGAAGTLAAAVPTWRFDVGREADLIEEIARLLGYDRVPLAPLPAPPVAPAPSPHERLKERLVAGARAAGFDEALTPSFVGEEILSDTYPIDKLVEIRNPISKADRFLRPFVFPTLGAAVARNLARGAGRVKLFEIGHAFRASPERPCEEHRAIALAAAGRRAPLDWSSVEEPPYDFFDLRGDIEDVIERAVGWRPEFAPGSLPFLHPGRQAEILDPEGRPIGFGGELHPRVARAWGVDERIYAAEWDWEVAAREPDASKAVSREPAVERDLALVVPDSVPAAAVLAAVGEAALENLVRVEVFDRYRGAQVEPGRYSLGVRLTFQADRTLTDEEVDREIERLIARLGEAHGFRLR